MEPKPEVRHVYDGPPELCRYTVRTNDTAYHCVSKSQVKRICCQLGDEQYELIERLNPLSPLGRKCSNLMDHPIQPIEIDELGTPRFKENKIVRKLLAFATKHGYGLNDIAVDGFSQNDREQLAQLIGYSLGGFAELSYVSNSTCEAAERMYKTGESEEQARIADLTSTLDDVRDCLRELVPRVFNIDPDDLVE